ncbi:polysaccharide deacetylase family protein [bacterium]|nr:polysaccharide deacetylase family protein [bacterium]
MIAFKQKYSKYSLPAFILLAGSLVIIIILNLDIFSYNHSIPEYRGAAVLPGYASGKNLGLSDIDFLLDSLNRDSCVANLKSSALSFYQSLEQKKQGGVPILVYHHVCPEHDNRDISLKDFADHLQILYDNGFRPIGLQEFLTFDFNLKKDQKPYILTFDDGWQDQFRVVHNQSDNLVVHDDCAIKVLQDFNRKHPDFNLRGVFYISLDKIPFGQKKYVSKKLNYLMDLGFEIGNHTLGHDNLASIPLDEFDRSIDEFMKNMESEMGFRSLMVKSLAFPYGSIPKDEAKWDYLNNYSFNNDSHSFLVFMSCIRKPCPLPGTLEFENANHILPRIPVSKNTVYSLIKRDDIYAVP